MGDDMKRYMLFKGECCYASGGISYFHDSFDSLVEAMDAGEDGHINDYTGTWFHVYDRVEGEIVHEEGRAING